MAPIPPAARIVCYHQTQYDRDTYISILPLITESTGVTHVIIGAVHLNERPGDITLNDDPPSHPKYERLWEETDTLQFSGIKVMAMLGGAAKGSFARLDGDEAAFEAFYSPLRDVLRDHNFEGVDLDVEEHMSLAGVIRLIDRLKSDFGQSFLITLAPVAPALHFGPHLSGFDYQALEVMRSASIAFYNVQFYCGWGNLENELQLDLIYASGWPSHKVVVGIVTNPANGSGWVPFETLQKTIRAVMARHKDFGGIMGWEYFNSLGERGEAGEPWEWAKAVSKMLGIAS